MELWAYLAQGLVFMGMAVLNAAAAATAQALPVVQDSLSDKLFLFVSICVALLLMELKDNGTVHIVVWHVAIRLHVGWFWTDDDWGLC